jgi:hypothetical protein
MTSTLDYERQQGYIALMAATVARIVHVPYVVVCVPRISSVAVTSRVALLTVQP